MKTNFTFAELSKIFAVVVKIQSCVAEQMEATKVYNEKAKIFDAEFEKYGYTFYNAPEELSDMFAEKCKLMEAKDKAERKAYKAIKEFADLIEICTNAFDWYEEDVKNYIIRKWYFDAEKIKGRCEFIAGVAARHINR